MKTKVLLVDYVTITLIVPVFTYLFLKGNESVTFGRLRRIVLDRSGIQMETKHRLGALSRQSYCLPPL